jgi:hypothetical protein
MAIDTNNEKLAVMELGDIWEPGLPMASTDTIDQADQQQLLLGFPGVLWAAGAALAFILDINTRMRQYLANYYGYPYETADLTTMMVRYCDALPGDYSARIHRLIDDATA